MTLGPGQHQLWPTPIGVHRLASASELNPLLVRVFGTMRAAQQLRDGQEGGAFFASDDDLVSRIRLPEWQDFVRFLVESLRDTAKAANAGAWPDQGLDLNVRMEGLWFQVSNQGAFHDIHTHGNCSWSGVYVVQVDDDEQRCSDPVRGALNGVTRFYGPPFERLGGAHVDAGNAYLQSPHVDVAPVAGQLVIFPSWLAHQAMPYVGAADRIIVSFNASLLDARGTDKRHGYAAA